VDHLSHAVKVHFLSHSHVFPYPHPDRLVILFTRQRTGFDSRRYHIFWDVVGLERGPFSLMSTIEELLGRKSRGSGLENREYCRRDPLRWPRGTLCLQRLALISLTIGCRSVRIVRSRTKARIVWFCSPVWRLWWPSPAINAYHCLTQVRQHWRGHQQQEGRVEFQSPLSPPKIEILPVVSVWVSECHPK
jgi:hypothetical protein